MTCAEFNQLRFSKTLFELTRAERAAFRDHFQYCSACRSSLRKSAGKAGPLPAELSKAVDVLVDNDRLDPEAK